MPPAVLHACPDPDVATDDGDQAPTTTVAAGEPDMAAASGEARECASFDEAFAAFHLAPPTIAKGAHSTDHGGYDYADLADVNVVLVALALVGLTWRCALDVDDQLGPVLRWRLRHGATDEQEAGTWQIAGGDPQEQGSAITYARRQCLLTATGLAPHGADDDGARASSRPDRPATGATTTARPAQRTRPRPAAEPEPTPAEAAARDAHRAMTRVMADHDARQARGVQAWVEREALGELTANVSPATRSTLHLPPEGPVTVGQVAAARVTVLEDAEAEPTHGDRSHPESDVEGDATAAAVTALADAGLTEPPATGDDDGDGGGGEDPDPWAGQGDPGEPPL